MAIQTELRAKGPYSLRLSCRMASDATRVIADGLYRATFRVGDRLERVQATQRADGTIVVAADSEAGVDHLRFALGLDDDHSEFVRRFAIFAIPSKLSRESGSRASVRRPACNLHGIVGVTAHRENRLASARAGRCDP